MECKDTIIFIECSALLLKLNSESTLCRSNLVITSGKADACFSVFIPPHILWCLFDFSSRSILPAIFKDCIAVKVTILFG